MTTCCVVNTNMDQSGDPGNQYCMTKHGSSYPQIVYCLRVSDVELANGWAYIKWSRLPRNTEASRFLSARQVAPRTKHFQKNFQQNTTQCPWRGEKIRDWPGLKDLALSWRVTLVRGSLIRSRARFFDTGEICKLRLHTVTCLAFNSLYVGKQHRTNNEPQNSIKWPWIEPRLNRKINNRTKFP